MELDPSKKYRLCLLVILCSTGLTAFGKVGGVEYCALMAAVAGVYSFANVAQKKLVPESPGNILP